MAEGIRGCGRVVFCLVSFWLHGRDRVTKQKTLPFYEVMTRRAM